jgi:hypothetical protein
MAASLSAEGTQPIMTAATAKKHSSGPIRSSTEGSGCAWPGQCRWPCQRHRPAYSTSGPSKASCSTPSSTTARHGRGPPLAVGGTDASRQGGRARPGLARAGVGQSDVQWCRDGPLAGPGARLLPCCSGTRQHLAQRQEGRRGVGAWRTQQVQRTSRNIQAGAIQGRQWLEALPPQLPIGATSPAELPPAPAGRTRLDTAGTIRSSQSFLCALRWARWQA